MSNLERSNLEAHVDLCAERYNQLHTKLDHVDSRLNKLETVIDSIYQELQSFRQITINRYLTWAGVIIGILCAVIGWMASRLL